MTDQGALESQLAGLRAQREQLVALVGDDPHSPLIQLQVCMYREQEGNQNP